MDKRFIIVHPSKIVQKGLGAIFYGFFNAESVLLDNLQELDNYCGLSNLLIYLFVDSDANEADLLIKKAQFEKLNNTVFIVSINNDAGALESANVQLDLFEDESSIFNKVSGLQAPIKQKIVSELSEREIDVLQLVALGNQNKDIAEKLFISIHTVISHRKNITEKLGIKSISGLTVYAILNKLINTENIDPSTLI